MLVKGSIPKNIDVIVLSECWINNIDMYKNSLPDYGIVYSSKLNRSGGVVLFYRKETISLIDSGCNFIPGADSVSITFDYAKLKCQTIIGIYRSPSENAKNFIENMNTWLRNHNTTNVFAVLGDMNLCRMKYDNDTNVEDFYDSLLEYALYPTINSYTRSSTTGTTSLIDQIFINYRNIVGNKVFSSNVDLNITDHRLQYVFIRLNRLKANLYENERPLIRIYNESNQLKFIEILNSCIFLDNRHADISSLNLYEDFQKQIHEAFEEAFPLIRLSKKKANSKTWFDSACTKALHKKQKLYKVYKASQNCSDKERYHKYNKYYKALIQQKKDEYNRNIIENCKSDSRASWKFINKLLGKSSDRPMIRILNNDEMITNTTRICNSFNSHFNEVGKLYGTQPSKRNDFAEYLGKRIDKSFFFREIESKEIKDILIKMNDKKATNDKIPLKIFKLCPDHVIDRLTYILNKIVRDGNMPTTLKTSKIIPVYKKGSRLDINNYRPISLLSYVDKILEKVIHSRLYSYLDKIEFLSPNQFGFREHHSTELSLLSVMNRIYTAVEAKEFIMLLSVDFRKAFEIIRHDILIEKLEHIGIRGFTLDWFKSYLNSRSHQTVVNGVLSETLYTKTGVPEGSTLGPLLFLIYINDMHNIFPKDELNIFADDTTLILKSRSLESLFSTAKSRLDSLEKFSKANGIRLNDSKTEYMIIHPHRSKEIDQDLYQNQTKINRVNCLKLLGVHIDMNLSFTSHANTILNTKLRKFLPIFYNLRRCLPLECLLKIYFANIHCILNYCILIFHQGKRSNIIKLEKLQRRLLKVIFRVKANEVDSHMTKHRILTVSDMYRYKMLSLCYKMIYKVDDLPHFLGNIHKPQSGSSLRNKVNLRIPFHRTSLGQRSIDFASAIEWNLLPRSIKEIREYDKFQKKLKQILVSKY